MSIPPVVSTPAVGGLITATWGANVAQDVTYNTVETPALLSGFVASTAVGYWIDAVGMVHLRGACENPTSTTIGVDVPLFQLPAGYRPSFQRFFPVTSTIGVIGVGITPAGFVSAHSSIPAGAGYQIDGINFDVL